MAGASIEVRVEDREVRRGFTRLVGVMENTTPVMHAIGVGLTASTHRRFVTQTSPEGVAWTALNPDYKAIKRNSRILTESGRLRGSISASAGRDVVVVGTNVVYAAIHQFGGTIEAKGGGHLVFRLASGLVMAKSVTLPAREYLGISADDEEMIADVVFGFVQRHAR